MNSLETIKEKLDAGNDLEEAISDLKWQDFEQIVSKIFEKHDYKIKTNFRFKTHKRWELDILAIGRLVNFGIDCKFWNKGRYKKSALKKALEAQKERVKELEKTFKGNEIAKKMLKFKKKTVPLIITWFEEDLIEHEDVLVVPVWKLNEFLLNYSNYLYK